MTWLGRAGPWVSAVGFECKHSNLGNLTCPRRVCASPRLPHQGLAGFWASWQNPVCLRVPHRYGLPRAEVLPHVLCPPCCRSWHPLLPVSGLPGSVSDLGAAGGCRGVWRCGRAQEEAWWLCGTAGLAQQSWAARWAAQLCVRGCLWPARVKERSYEAGALRFAGCKAFHRLISTACIVA